MKNLHGNKQIMFRGLSEYASGPSKIGGSNTKVETVIINEIVIVFQKYYVVVLGPRLEHVGGPLTWSIFDFDTELEGSSIVRLVLCFSHYDFWMILKGPWIFHGLGVCSMCNLAPQSKLFKKNLLVRAILNVYLLVPNQPHI